MVFDPHVAVIRFGMGLSPHHAVPESVNALLEELTGPDHMASAHIIPPFAVAEPSLFTQSVVYRARHQARGTTDFDAAEARVKDMQKETTAAQENNVRATFGRAVDSTFGMRERLVAFWADHFTVVAVGGNRRHLVSAYIEEAIRPHIAGRFEDMLRAVETHPMMLIYLQQVASVGPGSTIGQRRNRGLNENLAREMLELHTLGVGSPYTQQDVRELAEMLAGVTWTAADGQFFDPKRAEPGQETVLGVAYPAEASMETIHTVLRDLAAHPATAQHIARKLAQHFVADQPDPELVAAIAAVYIESQGDLSACYAAMLNHPSAWWPEAQKVRQPFDFIVACTRALGLRGRDLASLTTQDYRRLLFNPLRVMGQSWQNPTGPDGWPDRAEDWIIPQTMAGRVTWAIGAPRRLMDPLPDPREVVHWALGPSADPAVVFAAGAAETRHDGIGVVFASAAFNRR